MHNLYISGYAKCLSFNYHMFGSTMGYLYVIRDKTYIWGESRNQNIWHFVQINISSTVSRVGSAVIYKYKVNFGIDFFKGVFYDTI